jgi:hypothetical protein
MVWKVRESLAKFSENISLIFWIYTNKSEQDYGDKIYPMWKEKKIKIENAQRFNFSSCFVYLWKIVYAITKGS